MEGATRVRLAEFPYLMPCSLVPIIYCNFFITQSRSEHVIEKVFRGRISGAAPVFSKVKVLITIVHQKTVRIDNSSKYEVSMYNFVLDQKSI